MAPLKAVLCLLLASVASARCKRCVVPSLGGMSSDAPAIQDVFNRCSKDATIVFKEGVDYNVFEPVTADLTNVVISVQGDLHLPQNVTAVQELVSDAGGSLTWFTIKGTDVQWIGSNDINAGWVNSHGQAWYDANPPGGTGAKNRPHLMSFDVTNGIMDYFKSAKPIGWGVSLSGSNITISHAVVDAVSETGTFPFNTDGFDVGATDVTIQDSVVFNGDDAIAVGDGSHNVLFQRNTIGYQTHGMSIGSLGEDASKAVNVSNIRFDDITVAGGLYASRFKSWAGGQGLVENVSWTNIRIFNVSLPIFVTQTYTDQNTGSASRPDNSSVNMQNMKWENFTGSINSYQHGDGSCASDPCWYDVGLPNLKHTEAIILECNTESSCKDFEMKNIQIYPDNMSKTTVICMNAEGGLNPDLGFDCRNGTYVPES